MFKTIALPLKSALSRFWDTVAPSREPCIWQRCDRFGQMYWQVYDPIRDRSITFYSEQEVRQWLEREFFNGK